MIECRGLTYRSRARGGTRKSPCGLRRADVEDLIADRDAHAQRFVLSFAAEHAEWQVLYRKIAGLVRRPDPTRSRRIMCFIELEHVVIPRFRHFCGSNCCFNL